MARGCPLASAFAHGAVSRLRLGAASPLRPFGGSRPVGRASAPPRASQRASRADRPGGAGGARHARVSAGWRLDGGTSGDGPECARRLRAGPASAPGQAEPWRRWARRARRLRALYGPGGPDWALDLAGLQLRQRHVAEFPLHGAAIAPGLQPAGGHRFDHSGDPGCPGSARLSSGSTRPAGDPSATHGCGPACRLPPGDCLGRGTGGDGDGAPGAESGTRTRPSRGRRRLAGGRGPALPLRAARLHQGGAGRRADGHLSRARTRGTRPRAEHPPRGADRALRRGAPSRVQCGRGRLRAGARSAAAGGRARGGPGDGRHRAPRRCRAGDRRGGGRSQPLGRHELRQARRGHLRKRGGREHCLPRPSAATDSVRPDRGRLVLARLSRAGTARGCYREHPRGGRDRAPGGGWNCSGAGPAKASRITAAHSDGGRSRRLCPRSSHRTPAGSCWSSCLLQSS